MLLRFHAMHPKAGLKSKLHFNKDLSTPFRKLATFCSNLSCNSKLRQVKMDWLLQRANRKLGLSSCFVGFALHFSEQWFEQFASCAPPPPPAMQYFAMLHPQEQDRAQARCSRVLFDA